MLFNYTQFIFFVALSGFLYYICIKYQNYLGYELCYYVIFPIIFFTLNFAFVKIILDIINYFNNLFIIKDNNIFIIKTTLINTDNVEMLELDKIAKIDTEINGIVGNILSYGNLILEQYRDRTRIFHFIYKPYRAANYINEKLKEIDKKNN